MIPVTEETDQPQDQNLNKKRPKASWSFGWVERPPAHHTQVVTASAILCPSDSHEDILSSRKTQSGYMIVRWGILGGKKSNESITKTKKAEWRPCRIICGGRATGEIKTAVICEASRQLKIRTAHHEQCNNCAIGFHHYNQPWSFTSCNCLQKANLQLGSLRILRLLYTGTSTVKSLSWGIVQHTRK